MNYRFVPKRQPGRRLAPALALLTLAACEVPTGLPEWDTIWLAPGQGTTISVASLLPAEIATTPAGDAFQLNVAPVTVEASLGEACPSCALVNGLILPKPEFTLPVSGTAPLPADVVSASLASGQLDVTLHHDFGFDPLRPSATARGYLVLEARSGSTTLVRDSISGNETPWAQNTALVRSLPLSPAVLSSGVEVSATLYSPAGDPVQIDTNQKLTITATPTELRVTEAQVRVANQTIDAQEVELDLGDVDGAVVDHQKGGALLLDISNPFAVTGDIELTITAPGATIVKPLALTTGDFTARVDLSASELASILGQSPVRLRAAGSVSAPAEGTTIRPTQAVTINSRLELTIGPKEGQ